jgi:thioredoxin
MPCIIDFYADWCRPCREVAPILEELAKKYNGKIIFYKVNVDKERELARALGIQSIPTFFFIPVKGEPAVARGAIAKEDFERAINQILWK